MKKPSKEAPTYDRIIFGKINNSYWGGPFLWPESDYEYEFLEDQKNDGVPLAPGEERIYLVGCDRNIIDVKGALKNYPDEPIQWRVQLRRGLVKAKDDAGEEREISASCVIGVNLENADFPKTD